MAETTTPRMLQLQQMLQKEPSDTFLLYGLALELKKLNDTSQAIAYLDRVIALDSGYCYAYHQKGLIHESTGDIPAAKAAYSAGMLAAQKKGDNHALGEIEAALSMIEQPPKTVIVDKQLATDFRQIPMVEELVSYFKNPHWRRQHGWRKVIWSTMARVGLTGVHALPVNRRWIDIHRRAMPLPNLDPAMAGLKLVQISDLHYSPVVWKKYLVQFIDWINELEPDIVVVTGDLITGGYMYANRVAAILAHLRAPHGVICTFGNHDYSVYGKSFGAEGRRRADHLEKSLLRHKLIVLRNGVHYVRLPGISTPVAIVGLDDEWSGNIDAESAFANVDAGLPIICLNHNPVNCMEMMKHPWHWMLSGHTHGRQVATSALGRRLYPHRYRHFTHGYYAVNGRHLYVNRGLSYGQRVLDWCRPEVTVFKLECDGRSTTRPL